MGGKATCEIRFKSSVMFVEVYVNPQTYSEMSTMEEARAKLHEAAEMDKTERAYCLVGISGQQPEQFIVIWE